MSDPFFQGFIPNLYEDYDLHFSGQYKENPTVYIAGEVDEHDSDWVKGLKPYFTSITPERGTLDADCERLYILDDLSLFLRFFEQNKLFIDQIGMIAYGAACVEAMEAIRENSFAIPFVICINPSAQCLQHYDVVSVPVGVILGLGDADQEEEAVVDAFERLAAPDKVLYEIKNGGTRPMDKKPALFLIALRQAIYRFLKG